MKTLYLAWQDPIERHWYPVGKLDFSDGDYRFVYTEGALQSENFVPFGRMNRLHSAYRSEKLFPLFSNRVISRGRPEYGAFVEWLDLEEEEVEPLAMLARTGGPRATDSLLVFPHPERDESGNYNVHFFGQGIRYLGAGAVERIASLKSGDPLYLMPDPQNIQDSLAIAIRSDEPKALVGYCPRFMTSDFLNVLADPSELAVSVARVNPEAPIQYRLLCHLVAGWSEHFSPCSSKLYQPLSEG